MTNNHNIIADAHDAFDTIDRLTHCDCADPLPRTRFCFHFHFSTALRDLLIDRNYTPRSHDYMTDPPLPFYDIIRALLAHIDAAPYQTHRLSMLLLDNSLCPMHAIDYAICFDDRDPDCAAIRNCFPNHDT